MNVLLNRAHPAICLREWRISDLDLLLQLRNDVALQAQLLSTAQGSDMASVRAWLARRDSGENRVFRIISEPGSDVPMGYIQAEAEAGFTGTWRFGICLGGPFQGAGRGSAALDELEKLLARRVDARRLVLDVDHGNATAIRCYRRLGYQPSGATSRQVLVCSELRDVLSMNKSIATEESGQ